MLVRGGGFKEHENVVEEIINNDIKSMDETFVHCGYTLCN
jgi:hypothetical protein